MNKKERAFVEQVYQIYKEEGRHTLPWRKTKNPYRIVVSEIMLQQTQVDRVIPKYQSFLKKFPTVQSLADASLGEVLRMWQGLGYNRRAKMLHQCAKEVCKKHKGIFPKDFDELKKLSGAGPYTAGAVMAFAYNNPTAVIETNIRTVYLHHFFKGKENISDTEIMKYVKRTLDIENPREWYWALMDYGAILKKKHGNANTRSQHYTKQSRFKGSDREVRGAILRALAGSKKISELPFPKDRIDVQCEKLLKEGMIEKRGRGFKLP